METKPFSNSLLLDRFTDAVASRGHYYGDLDNAPTGEFTVRADSGCANAPTDKNGHLSSVANTSGSSIQKFFTTDESYLSFYRTRWYQNPWLPWRKIETSPMNSTVAWGGGKSLPFNQLRNLAERRVA